MYNYLAEFLGVVFFVYILLATSNPLATGAAFALALLMTGSISKGGLNPAITVAMAAAGKIEPSEIIPYSIVQVIGALIALEIFKRYTL